MGQQLFVAALSSTHYDDSRYCVEAYHSEEFIHVFTTHEKANAFLEKQFIEKYGKIMLGNFAPNYIGRLTAREGLINDIGYYFDLDDENEILKLHHLMTLPDNLDLTVSEAVNLMGVVPAMELISIIVGENVGKVFPIMTDDDT